MNDEQMRRRRRKVAIVVVLIAAAVLAPSAVIMLLPKEVRGHASGDTLDIRLVGVWRGDDTDVYDAAGNRMGETMGSVFWTSGLARERLERNFIFEAPASDGDIELLDCSITPAGRKGPRFVQTEWEGLAQERWAKGILVQTQMPADYLVQPFAYLPILNRYRYTADLRSVDVTLSYLCGRRGAAEHSFVGPFTDGATVTADGDNAATVTVSGYYDLYSHWGTEILISTTRPPASDAAEIAAYDLSGRRLEASDSGGSRGRGGAVFGCRLSEITPDEISAVTLGEETRKKTFHNVVVAYSDRPERKHPAYLEEVCRRLGSALPGAEGYASPVLADAAEAMKVIDVVRGNYIERAHDAIMEDREGDALASLGEEDRARFRAAIDKWCASEDISIRARGVSLGLELDTNAYVAKALEIIGGKDYYGITGQVGDLGARLDEDSLRRIGEFVRAAPKRWTTGDLMDALAANESAEATRELVEMAGSDWPWLWYRALAEKKVRDALGPVETRTRQLRIRAYVATGCSDGSYLPADAAPGEALEVLESCITADFLEADRRLFEDVLEVFLAKCERERCTEAFVRFARDARNSYFAQEPLSVIIRHINLWYGTDIAGIGGDPGETDALIDERNWRQAAADLVGWRESGTVAQDVPSGYRAAHGDLRILLVDDADKERSGIGLWIKGDPAGAMRVRSVKSESGELVYSIHRSETTENVVSAFQGDYRFYCVTARAGVEYWSGTQTDFSSGGLPKVNAMPGEQIEYTVVIEDADNSESVLSGTRVFENWWNTYGADSARGK